MAKQPSRTCRLATFLVFLGILPLLLQAEDMPTFGQPLLESQITTFAQLSLDGIDQEYPNKPSQVMVGPESVLTPRQMHPAFYGCFDWHSAVHSHWMLVRLLKQAPDHPLASEIRRRLDEHLSLRNLEAEAAYFRRAESETFERMYGWAWLLRLTMELKSWDDPQAARWCQHLEPLESLLVERTMAYLPKLTWPIRTGVHPDTGFALAQILDYARGTGNESLATMVERKSVAFYQQDRNYAVSYEPSGEDFFSSGLNEADLMRRVLPADRFAVWLGHFFPTLEQGKLGNLLQPAQVSDIADGKLVHLAGLNFSRAWTMRGIAGALPVDDPQRSMLERSASAHLAAGLSYVASGNYEGDHWLATFAVYALSDAGQATRP